MLVKDKNRLEESIYVRIVRATLEFYSFISSVKLHENIPNKRKACTKILIKLEHFGLFISFIHLSISVYYAYLYDYELYKLRKFRLVESSRLIENSNYTQNSDAEHFERIKAARLEYKQVGAPFIDLRYLNQYGMITMMICGLYNKILLPIYFHYREPFCSDLIWALLTRQGDKEWTSYQIINPDLLKLVKSCRSFISANGQRKAKDHVDYLMFHHMMPMMAEQELSPFNRKPDWLVRLCKIFCFANLSMLIFYLVILNFLMFQTGRFSWLQINGIEIVSIMDLVVLIEYMYISYSTVICLNYYVCLAVFTCFDQTLTANVLVDAFSDCIKRNESKFMFKNPSPQSILFMNRNALRVFSHYRMFISQNKMAFAQQGSTMVMVIASMPIQPALVYLQAPFMEREMLAVVNSICIVTFVFIAIFWLPFRDQQTSSQRLYRSLHSLAAHMAAIQVQGDTYSYHMIDLVAKELREPQKLFDYLTVKKFGIKFTYGTFLVRCFWCGLILLLANSEKHLRNEGSGMARFLTIL